MEEKIMNLLILVFDKIFVFEDLEIEIVLNNVDDFKLMVKVLVKLEDFGIIVCLRKNWYVLLEKMDLVKGIFCVYEWGFGFVFLEEKEMDDIFILLNEVKDVMNGDLVFVIIMKCKGDNLVEGMIKKIVEWKIM